MIENKLITNMKVLIMAEYKCFDCKKSVAFEYIKKKVSEILENPYHFKPLKAPMQNYRRVHIGSFVLVYSIDENKKAVILERYEHHDSVYKA